MTIWALAMTTLSDLASHYPNLKRFVAAGFQLELALCDFNKVGLVSQSQRLIYDLVTGDVVAA